MRKVCLILLTSLVLVGGCCPPGAIKREIDFVDTVTKTALKEANAETDQAKRAEKMYRALKRMEPHTDNLKRWVDKKKPKQ